MKKQNKKIKKRFCSLLLCLAMLLTVVPASAAQMEEAEPTEIAETETTEVEKTEIAETEVTEEYGIALASEEEIQTAQADITAPVIESIISFEGNEQPIQPDTYLYLTISAYDDEEISWDNSTVYVSRDDNTSSDAGIENVEKLEGNQYKLTLNVSWHAGYNCYISGINLKDESGNEKYLSFGEDEYKFTVELPATEGLKITSIQFDKTDIVLTDDITEVELKYSAILEGDTSEIPYIYFEFIAPDGNGDTRANTLYRNDENPQLYEGTRTLYYYDEEGTYTFKWAQNYGGTSQIPYDGEIPAFTLSKQNTDKEAPVIESLAVTKGGAPLENGTLLKKGDVLEVSVKMQDAGKIETPTVEFRTDLENVSQSYQYVDVTYDEASGCYAGSIELTDFYATEWYIDEIYVRDVYGNSEWRDLESIYFYVTEEDGSCSIPTYTYNVTFYIDNQSQQSSVTAGKRTSLKEMFPNGLPAAPVKEGYTFLGWYDGNSGTLYQEEDVIVAYSYGRDMYLYPAYDKVDIEVYVYYYGEDGRYLGNRVVEKTVASGTTYKEIYNSVDLSGIKHNSQVVFEGWDCYYADSEEGIYRDYSMNIEAVYDKLVASFYFQYYDENSQPQYLITAQLFEKGVTYAEVAQKLVMPELKHSETMKFVEWEISSWYLENNPQEEYNQGDTISYKAIYENEAPEATIPDTPTTPDIPDYSWSWDDDEEEVTEPVTQPVVQPQQIQTPVRTQEEQREEMSDEPAAVKLEEAVIEAEVEKVTQAAEGETFVISMTKEDGSVATEVPVAVLEAARGKNVDIVLDMGGYSWTINGNDILATNLEAINLEVTLDTEAVAPSIVDALAGGEPTRQLSLTHNGDFGFKAKLNINVGSEYEGQFGNLYYYDSNNKLVFMNAGEVQADGSVSLDFSHASDYVVVVGRDRTEEETVIVEDTEVVEETEEVTAEEAPAEEAGNAGAVAGVIVALVAVIAAAVFMLKKKGSK